MGASHQITAHEKVKSMTTDTELRALFDGAPEDTGGYIKWAERKIEALSKEKAELESKLAASDAIVDALWSSCNGKFIGIR